MPSPHPLLQELNEPVAAARGVRLLLWRDDLAHSDLPGNKARKLKYNLAAARQQGHNTLLTFGGAYSNHIAAVATAGRLYGFQTIGLIRGDAPIPGAALNPTLARAATDGMALHYLDRSTYRRRSEPKFLAEMQARYGLAYVLPEGGTNALALPGCAELVAEIRQQVAFDALAVAVGTGGTLAGLLTGLAGAEQAVGVAALKNGSFLRAEVDALTQAATGEQPHASYSVQTDYHFGGYAKYSAELLAFIARFRQRHQVLLDPIYTGKLLFGVLDLIGRGHFAPGRTVVAIHTGGQQAWAGWEARFGPA